MNFMNKFLIAWIVHEREQFHISQAFAALGCIVDSEINWWLVNKLLHCINVPIACQVTLNL